VLLFTFRSRHNRDRSSESFIQPKQSNNAEGQEHRGARQADEHEDVLGRWKARRNRKGADWVPEPPGQLTGDVLLFNF
jgi:hypothetical protein